MASFRTTPYSLELDKGGRLHWRGAEVLIKATTDQTGGTFNLFEMICPVGFATSLDIHYSEDIAVFVLEGTLTFFWGRETKEATSGTYFYQPRGTPHGFRVEGDSPARILYLTIPAGLDRLIMEEAHLAPNSDPVTAAARHKIEILGPLPE